MVLPGRERSLTISLAVWIQYINVTDGQTDGQWTPGDAVIKMIFKYELGFVAFTWPNLCLLDLSLLFIVLVGRNFVTGIL